MITFLLIWILVGLGCHEAEAEGRFRVQQDLDELRRKSDREHQKRVEELHRRLAEIKECEHTFPEEVFFEEHGYYPGEEPKRKRKVTRTVTKHVNGDVSASEITEEL